LSTSVTCFAREPLFGGVNCQGERRETRRVSIGVQEVEDGAVKVIQWIPKHRQQLIAGAELIFALCTTRKRILSCRT